MQKDWNEVENIIQYIDSACIYLLIMLFTAAGRSPCLFLEVDPRSKFFKVEKCSCHGTNLSPQIRRAAALRWGCTQSIQETAKRAL